MKPPVVRIGDICQVVSGATPSTTVSKYWGGPIPWITPKDISALNSKYIGSWSRSITDAGLRSCAATILPANSVLLSSRAPIGHVALSRMPVATNQGFKSLVPDTRAVFPDYLYYWLKANVPYLQSLGNGATFKELSKKTVEDIEIPLPTLSEQQRIADTLDRAKALSGNVRRRDRSLTKLGESLFVERFGSPMANDDRWNTYLLGEMGTVTTGNTPPRSHADNYGGALEWIKSDNILQDWPFLASATEKLSAVGSQIARSAPPGSLLVTCIAGSPNSIGNVAIADRTVSFNQQINAITPNPLVNTEFLYVALKLAKKLVQEKSTGGMKGLVSKSRFESIRMICPPHAQQNEFRDAFMRVVELRLAARDVVQATDSLFASLQYRAFRGQS